MIVLMVLCLYVCGFYGCCLGRIISHLEKGTLKFLAENERIASFSPTLHERFKQAYESSTAKVSIGTPHLMLSHTFVVVLFMLALMLMLSPATVVLSCLLWEVSESVLFFFFFWPWVSELQVAVTDSSESLLAGHTLCSRC